MSASSPVAPPSGHLRRRFLVPEVVQTSGMDCGPAALKALLEGFGVRISYGRLREACHTDVDGTSIDTLEETARALSLPAEQIIIPVDHVLKAESAALPAIAVTQRPTGGAHFVVLWRRHGNIVQMMDPARGRLWVPRSVLESQLYRHTAVAPADAWRSWAGTDSFLVPLSARLRDIGLSSQQARRRLDGALQDLSWKRLARLDASVRMLADLIDSKALRRTETSNALDVLQPDSDAADLPTIPDAYWFARPVESDDAPAQLRIRGAVLVRVSRDGRVTPSANTLLNASPELAAAISERPPSVGREILAAAKASGITGPAVGLIAVTIAALGVVFEALLLRSVLDISALLPLPAQGVAAGAALVTFAALLLGVELVLASAERRTGSHLEARLRIAFLAKLPRLSDSYFQSRPVSDMLERSHMLHVVRTLPPLTVRFLRVVAELVITTAAIAWLDPRAGVVAALACVVAAAIPFAGSFILAERDLKVRTHAGALARFHLDALLGRTAIDAHGAAATIEREHERLLAEWAHASMGLQRSSVAIEGIQMAAGFGLAAWLLFGQLGGELSGTMLLMTYWVLNVPALGYELALAVREFPAHRSVILRLLEPLGAPESNVLPQSSERSRVLPGVRVDMKRLAVRTAGHEVLHGIDLHIEPGSHVAIVGASGAGKSTLVGLLLGWHRPYAGELLIDGEVLTADRLDALRSETAWVDPSVQIWNRSLLENVLYGSGAEADAVPSVLESALLMPVVARLPQGLATPLGEGGALLSAGERQRVRLARAMMRSNARLVILDEALLGLERDRRRSLLAQARQRWSGRTLLYVTHDVAETRSFDRVIVMDRGGIVEEGHPHQLAQLPSSRYRRLLQSQELVHARLTTGAEWRRIRLESGRITQEHTGVLEQRA